MSTPLQFPARVYRVQELLHASREKFDEMCRAIEEGRRIDAQHAEASWLALRRAADRASGEQAG